MCYACVFGDLKSLCKDRIERSKPGLSEESVAAVALRCAALCSAAASGREAFSPSPMQRSIVKSSAPSGTFRSTFFYSLYATSARNRKRLLWSSRTGYYSKKTFKRLKKVQSQRRKTEERTRANGRDRERDRERFKCRVRFSVL